jgi:hypothetical protein
MGIKPLLNSITKMKPENISLHFILNLLTDNEYPKFILKTGFKVRRILLLFSLKTFEIIYIIHTFSKSEVSLTS